MHQAMMRIISRPPGEAPEDIRDKWVGLVLPVVGNHNGLVAGIMTHRVKAGGGYVVRWADAMEVLGRAHPDARAWWETQPVLGDLVFERSCAEILAD